MKAYIIQPPYYNEKEAADELFRYKLDLLDKCDESHDIIVLPEYSDLPCVAPTREITLEFHDKYIDPLLKKCVETAKRCSATLFVNALSLEEDGLRNTTYCYNKNGELVGKYFKVHLPLAEKKKIPEGAGYTYEPTAPYTVTIDGVKYGFMTCYDFYFYENYAPLARENPDVIIGCSHQRSDTHLASQIMCQHLAYNTNAYVLRSSVSFAEDANICGGSCAVAPDGEVLYNMGSRFGAFSVEFDPHKRYLKPAGFGNPDAPHHQYIEVGRTPWNYRPAGPSMIRDDDNLPYPRVCSHRGFNTIAPENSMPAFGAAISLGAEEIEFDLWATRDGVIVSCHDALLDRVSDGTGFVFDKTWDELKTLDFGFKFSEDYRGLRIVLFEDILKKFSCQIIMNIHVKTMSDEFDPETMKKIVALVRRYDCEKHCYFMIAHDGVVKMFKEYAPDIKICLGHRDERPWGIVDAAIELGCEKVQFYNEFYNQEMVDKARAHGIICNYFHSEDEELTKKLLEMGMDTILTNNFNKISQVVER